MNTVFTTVNCPDKNFLKCRVGKVFGSQLDSNLISFRYAQYRFHCNTESIHWEKKYSKKWYEPFVSNHIKFPIYFFENKRKEKKKITKTCRWGVLISVTNSFHFSAVCRKKTKFSCKTFLENFQHNWKRLFNFALDLWVKVIGSRVRVFGIACGEGQILRSRVILGLSYWEINRGYGTSRFGTENAPSDQYDDTKDHASTNSSDNMPPRCLGLLWFTFTCIIRY